MKKVNRVKKYREFHEILNNRNTCERGGVFVVYYKKNDFGFERYGLLVTKKNGIAVIRNKIKRQVRMMVDKVSNFTKSIDVIIVVRQRYDVNQYEENEKELTLLLSKIRSKNEY